VFLSILFSAVPEKIAAAFGAAAPTADFQAGIAAGLQAPPGTADNSVATALQQAASSGSVSAASSSGVLSDSSFLTDLDPRLAKPFLVGFSDAMDLVFLVGAAVMVVGFLIMLRLPHVELRSGSAYSERNAAPEGSVSPEGNEDPGDREVGAGPAPAPTRTGPPAAG